MKRGNKMKKSLMLLLSIGLAAPAFADTLSYHLVDSANFEFAAPIVSGASNYTNQLPYGSIIYDASTDQFKGLDRNGNWDAMSSTTSTQNVSSTNGTATYHVEYVYINSVCSSSPCTLTSSSAGIASVTRSGPGTYSVNFNSGTFTKTPACNVTAANNVNGNYTSIQPTNNSTSAFAFDTTNTFNGGVATDSNYISVICMGQNS
jgi:hypothetical protein